MPTNWLHRYALLVAACTALLFVDGPAVTGNQNRPLYSLGQTHLWAGPVICILIAGLAIWLLCSKQPAWLRWLAGAALGANIAEALLGMVDTDPLPPWVRICHSLLAQLLFSTTVALAVFTSAGRNQTPEPARHGSLLRILATATPVLLLSQVALGTAFRHGVLGMGPHVIWALVLLVFLGLTLAGILSLENSRVHPAGIVLTVVASAQMILGFALYTMQAIDADPAAMIMATTAHATTGALTLASAVVLAILVRRTIRGDANAARVSGPAVPSQNS